MQVIDSDGHLHEPFDLFERYMDKEFFSMRPRMVELVMNRETPDAGWSRESSSLDFLSPKALAEAASDIRHRATPR